MKRRPVLRAERGQALVEFSLVGIVFFMIVLGMVDTVRMVWNYNALAEATREGTRYAIVHGAQSADPSGPGSSYYTAPDSDSKVTEKVEQFAGGLNPSQLTVQSEWIDGSNQAGGRIKVTSQYQVQPFFGFIGGLSFTMSSSSTMKITY
jgi:Flp pilus assembly protein TadG